MAEANFCTKIIIVSINVKALEDENVKGSFFWWANNFENKYNYYNKKHTFDGTGAKKYQATISQETNDILLLNYESLFDRSRDRDKKCQLKKNIVDFILSCHNCNVALIVDESHKIKSTNSIQTLAIKQIQMHCRLFANSVRTYLLTGTPFTAGFEDLYSQLKLLGWQGTKTAFTDMFCIRGNLPSLLPWQQPIVDYKNIDELFKLVHKYAITIKSDEVLHLPEQIFINHELPSSDALKLYTAEKLKADVINTELHKRKSKERVEQGERDGKVNNPFYRNIAYPELKWVADTTATFWLRARQLSIGFQGNEQEAIWYDKSRIDELEKLLTEHEDNYVIFYNFTPEFIELYELCEKLDYKIDVYNGLIKSLRHYQEFSNFSDGKKLVEKKRVILANFASGSTGVNWQDYNKCVLFSLPLFKDYQQGIKRVHRVGQKNTVIYHMFYQKNWLDDSMMKSLNDKKEYDKDMFEADLKRIQQLFANE